MPCLNNYFCYSIDALEIKKNTPKGALCKYSNSFEECLLNCDTLRAFFKPDLNSLAFRTAQKRLIGNIRRVSADFDFKK